jgi:hypothetical protein
MPELTFIILDSMALDSELAFLNEDGLASSGSESPSPSTTKAMKNVKFEVSMAVRLLTVIFWVTRPCILVGGYLRIFILKTEAAKNIGNHL